MVGCEPQGLCLGWLRPYPLTAYGLRQPRLSAVRGDLRQGHALNHRLAPICVLCSLPTYRVRSAKCRKERRLLLAPTCPEDRAYCAAIVPMRVASCGAPAAAVAWAPAISRPRAPARSARLLPPATR